MVQFEDRERSYESRFAKDEELRFKAVARRNRLLGQWAAEKLGRTGDEADAYTKAVVRSDFEKPGDDDVLHKVVSDFKAAGVAVSENDVRLKMRQLLISAAEQLTSSET